MINNGYICLLATLIPFFCTSVLNRSLVPLAYRKKMTDNPGRRKLQKKPVPVIGGVAVFVSFVISTLVCDFFVPMEELYVPIACVTMMFLTGFLDDMIDISPKLRFLIEISVIATLWYHGYRLDTLGGIFGVDYIPPVVSLLFSIFCGVGLVNSLNMIDGVNGLASGLSICTSIACFWVFWLHGDILGAIMACCFIGALIPFFIYNVFSQKFKMFIGDSGSLMIGIVAYIFTCRIIHQPQLFTIDRYDVSMMLAMFAIPILDTFRVMTSRVLRGVSPFTADKTHLHHLFVGMGYPHVVVTTIILLMGAMVFLVWYLLSLTNLSPTVHFLLVFIASMLIVYGTYFREVHIQKTDSERFAHHKAWMIDLLSYTNTFSRWMQKMIDGKPRRG